MASSSRNDSMSNLVATIDSVAAGESFDDSMGNGDEHEHDVTAADLIEGGIEMLDGTVLQLADGQVVQVTGSSEDGFNVVQVETTEFDNDNVDGTVEEMCEIDIDQQHIFSETGSHVIVKTEGHVSNGFAENSHSRDQPSAKGYTSKSSPVDHPSIPFSFPGQTFDTKCQKLILNVWDFFRRLKKNPDLLDEIRTPQERAAAALHISAATIGKIGKNFKKTGKLEPPGKRRKRAKPVVDSVTPDQEKIIRNIIKELKDHRVVPTLPLILSECRERINFQGGATSFRRILHRMGYKGLANKLSFNNVTSNAKSKSPSSSSTATTSTSTAIPSTKTIQTVQLISATDPVVKRENESFSYISLPLSTSSSSTMSKAALKTKSLNPPNLKFKSIPIKQETPVKQNSAPTISLFGNNVFQLAGSQLEDTLISQETATAIANAAIGEGEGPQTIQILHPDNTIQQIQVVYTNSFE